MENGRTFSLFQMKYAQTVGLSARPVHVVSSTIAGGAGGSPVKPSGQAGEYSVFCLYDTIAVKSKSRKLPLPAGQFI